MRVLALFLAAMLAVGGCSSDDSERRSAPDGPSGDITPGTSQPTSPDQEAVVEPSYEDCPALAVYLSEGGSSHDDTYDSGADTLYVYSVDSRQFLLTSSDSRCISRSAAISRQVRDALLAHQANVGGPVASELLVAATQRRSVRSPEEVTSCSDVMLPVEGVGDADFSTNEAAGTFAMHFMDTRDGEYRNVSYVVRYLDDPTCRTTPGVAELIGRVDPPGWRPVRGPTDEGASRSGDPLGILADPEFPLSGTDFLGCNRWHGFIDGYEVSASAGYAGYGHAATGEVMTIWSKPLPSGRLGQRLTVRGSGPLQIISVARRGLILSNAAGSHFLLTLTRDTSYLSSFRARKRHGEIWLTHRGTCPRPTVGKSPRQ